MSIPPFGSPPTPLATFTTAGKARLIFINVKDYGALGDGSHDDTTNIQNAINAGLALANAGSATIFFPPGTYKITAALVCTSATGSASGYGVILRGAGKQASRIFKASSFGVAVTYNGNGGPSGNNTAHGGIVDLTVDGNATTGGLLQTNSAQQMFFRGCSFIGSNDWAWDLNTMQDSYFEQITFNNCGSSAAPVIKIYGSANGTSNMLWFEQVRIETFLNGAVWITRGAGASGGGNNGFFWSQCKFENFPTVHGDIFVADGYTQQLIMDQIFISFGQYDGVYATPANGIVFGDGSTGSGLNQASFTNIFMNTGPTALIGDAVIRIKGASGMTGPVKIDNVECTSALTTAVVVVNTASTLKMDIRNLDGSGTLLAGDGTTGLGNSGQVWTSNGTAALPTWQGVSAGTAGIVTFANLTHGNANGSLGSAATSSITPGANKLILAAITIRNGVSINPTAPTLSGNGLTWVQVGTTNFDSTSGSRRAIYLFRAMGSAPTAGAITITFGETETDVTWSIDQGTNVDTSGTNGSGAVVQTVTNKDETGGLTSLTVSLSAFSSILNAVYGAFGTDGNTTGTAGTGFTVLGHDASGTNITVDTEYFSGNQTAIVENWTGAGLLGGVAVEIKAALPSGSGITRNVSSLTTSTTLGSSSATDYTVFLGSGAAPIMPAALSNANRYTVKNIDTTSKTVTTTGSDTIEGTGTITIVPGASVDLVSNGTALWYVV